MKRKTARIIELSILGVLMLGFGGYYLLRYSGSTVKPSVERTIYGAKGKFMTMFDNSEFETQRAQYAEEAKEK